MMQEQSGRKELRQKRDSSALWDRQPNEENHQKAISKCYGSEPHRRSPHADPPRERLKRAVRKRYMVWKNETNFDK
jgi:hypothetical protein